MCKHTKMYIHEGVCVKYINIFHVFLGFGYLLMK